MTDKEKLTNLPELLKVFGQLMSAMDDRAPWSEGLWEEAAVLLESYKPGSIAKSN